MRARLVRARASKGLFDTWIAANVLTASVRACRAPAHVAQTLQRLAFAESSPRGEFPMTGRRAAAQTAVRLARHRERLVPFTRSQSPVGQVDENLHARDANGFFLQTPGAIRQTQIAV
jgi:hypothetical protein